MTDPAGERQNLGLLCFYPYRALESRLLAALAAAGFDDITIAQGRVAARIGEHGTSPEMFERLVALGQSARVVRT